MQQVLKLAVLQQQIHISSVYPYVVGRAWVSGVLWLTASHMTVTEASAVSMTPFWGSRRGGYTHKLVGSLGQLLASSQLPSLPSFPDSKGRGEREQLKVSLFVTSCQKRYPIIFAVFYVSEVPSTLERRRFTRACIPGGGAHWRPS